MPGFNDAWSAISAFSMQGKVSPELRPLLERVYSHVLANPPDLAGLKHALIALLEFLATDGRTNANCWAVDMFFAESEGWERDWTDQELPDDFHEVLAMMGEALHDTVWAPDIAQNFECLPEQLLDQVKRILIDG